MRGTIIKNESSSVRGTTRRRNNTTNINSSSSIYPNSSNKKSSAIDDLEDNMLFDSIKDHSACLEIIDDNSNDDEGSDNNDNEIGVDTFRERKERMRVHSNVACSNIRVATNDDDYHVTLNDPLKVDDDDVVDVDDDYDADDERKDSSNSNNNSDTDTDTIGVIGDRKG